MAVEIAAVVPTLGMSPLLGQCLEALRRDAGSALEICVVHQGSRSLDLDTNLVDRIERCDRELGFAAATNRGLAGCRSPLVATVNDDVVIETGWTAALTQVLSADPNTAAAQGVNLLYSSTEVVDGCGLGWNRWWQAVQMGHGKAAPSKDQPAREIFGASATAALYRREALLAVSDSSRGVFEPALVTYYEDVELACRLRAAGYRTLLVPRARAQHAGSTSGRQMNLRRRAWIYGNRYLVLARLLGSAFWKNLPRVWLRDAADLTRACWRLDAPAAAGILAGWARAAAKLPRFLRLGGPQIPLAELKRFQVNE